MRYCVHIIKFGDTMEKLKNEIVKMRYTILVKKGLVENKYNSPKNMSKIVKEYESQFIPGTVLLSKRAGYKLRIEYPIE